MGLLWRNGQSEYMWGFGGAVVRVSECGASVAQWSE